MDNKCKGKQSSYNNEYILLLILSLYYTRTDIFKYYITARRSWTLYLYLFV